MNDVLNKRTSIEYQHAPARKRRLIIILVSAAIIAPMAFLAIDAAIHRFLDPYPIHAHQPSCDDGRIVFSSHLSPEYLENIRRHFARYDAPYAVVNSKIYTSGNGEHYGNIDKQIRLIAEKDIEGPTFRGQRGEKISVLYDQWINAEVGVSKSQIWCHVVEMIVSPTGIDAEARRSRPDIWPRDKFPLPDE